VSESNATNNTGNKRISRELMSSRNDAAARSMLLTDPVETLFAGALVIGVA
jgi:hypothetical protein